MQFNFFALYSDKIKILEYIFSETSFKVVDHYSDAGQELKQYKSIQEIEDKFDLSNQSTKSTIHFALWNEAYGETNIVRKVDLNPKYCKGHTFRFAANGFSLQQLYFEGLKGDLLRYSTMMGFTEKTAVELNSKQENANQIAHKLDWKQVISDQRKLKSFIERKLTVRKQNTYLILSEAEQELQLGHIKI